MKIYLFEEFLKDIELLVTKIDFNPDAILIVARGGLTIGHFLAERLNIRNVYLINAKSYDNNKQQKLEIFNIPKLNCKNLLIVDDIADSGKTLKKVYDIISKKYPSLNIKSAVIFYKKTSIFKPDFFVKEAKEWIKFFWERD